MSVIISNDPERWSTAIRLAWQQYSLGENDLRMFSTSGEVLLQNLYIHKTTVVLLYKIAGLWCLKASVLTAFSNAFHSKKIFSSSKSEIVIFLSGFSCVHSYTVTSSGYLRYHTKDARGFVPPNHTPTHPTAGIYQSSIDVSFLYN